MSIQSEINRLKGAVAAAYTAAAAKGATMPASQNADNLRACVSSIAASVSGTKLVLPFGSVSAGTLSL